MFNVTVERNEYRRLVVSIHHDDIEYHTRKLTIGKLPQLVAFTFANKDTFEFTYVELNNLLALLDEVLPISVWESKIIDDLESYDTVYEMWDVMEDVSEVPAVKYEKIFYKAYDCWFDLVFDILHVAGVRI